jgi:cytochrome c-type biogenesis protein CcmH/NrfG
MRIFEFIICVLSVSVAFFQVGPAYAGIIGTDKSFNEFSAQNDRAKLSALIARDEVRGLLASNGLTVEEAQQRVNALTDKEAKQLAEKFDEQAAGGVLIALLIIFLVFIILELAGVTDIFTGI